MTPVPRTSAEPASAIAQELARLAASPEVISAFEWFRNQETEFARWQLELARIPAPPFGETARSDWLAEHFRMLGLLKVHKDGIGNVFGSKSGVSTPIISISAHLDTVFPAHTPLNIRQQGSKLSGPGISDNASGVTALLAIAESGTWRPR